MARERILIIEDDPTPSRVLRDNCAHEGYETECAADGKAGLEMALGSKTSLILLDIMLPKINGYDLCRLLREAGLETPIIMLTAKAQEADIVLGLNAGADDYVTKPFRLAELLARVRALLRRRGDGEGAGELVAGGVRVDVAGHRAFLDDKELQLSGKEFELLHVLVAHAGAVVSRDTLMRDVWEADAHAPSKTLDMHVSWLRRKLGDDAASPKYITTVRGMGFRFEND